MRPNDWYLGKKETSMNTFSLCKCGNLVEHHDVTHGNYWIPAKKGAVLICHKGEPVTLKLNENGQCPVCKIKPLKYKIHGSCTGGKHYFCHRCDRAFSLDTLEHVPNWAYVKNAHGALVRQTIGYQPVEKS